MSGVTVVMVGPDRGAVGGMASVINTIDAGVGEEVSLRVVDSGGGTGPAGWLAWPGALARVAASRFDEVHLHVASQGSTWRKLSFALVAAARRRPYLIHLHGAGYVAFLDSLPGPLRAVVARFFSRAAAVVVLGERWRDLVVERLGVPADRVHLIANGVAEVPPRPLDPEHPVVVFVGEVSHRKGADVLLTAARDVLTAHPDARLQLLGPTPDDACRDAAVALGEAFPGRVELTGPLQGAPKDARIGAADVFCLPSRAENLPMALLEAMSAGLACVSTPVGAIGEAIDEHNGRLVPPGDAAALAAALDDLLADADLRRRLGEAARQTWRERYSAAFMVRALTDLWRAVARARKEAR